MAAMRRSSGGGLVSLLVVLLVVVFAWQLSSRDLGFPTADPTPSPRGQVDLHSGLPIVRLDTLPPEAADTVRLIDRGGPFPYGQDGATFGNREGLLPDRESGYYREYTVETPGSDDRGERRIVGGGRDELYWTADHYSSFERIRR